jgi:hypothetical protein
MYRKATASVSLEMLGEGARRGRRNWPDTVSKSVGCRRMSHDDELMELFHVGRRGRRRKPTAANTIRASVASSGTAAFERGTSVVVAHPGQLRLIYRSNNKSDRNDAERLAKLIYRGGIPTVHVPSLVRTWPAKGAI